MTPYGPDCVSDGPVERMMTTYQIQNPSSIRQGGEVHCAHFRAAQNSQEPFSTVGDRGGGQGDAAAACNFFFPELKYF